MRYKQTYFQYNLWLRIFSLFLFVQHLRMYPYLDEIYLRIMEFGSTQDFNYPKYFPSIFYLANSSMLIHVCHIIILAACIGIFFNFGRRLFCFIQWFLLASFYSLNPFTLTPELPFFAWALLACSLVPEPESSDDTYDWRLPPIIYYGGFIVLGAAYFYAGETKLFNAHWTSGEALEIIATQSVATQAWFHPFASKVPSFIYTLGTWSVLFAQTTSILFFAIPKTRFWFWAFLLFNHIAVLILFRIPDVSLGMILFHLFLFDQNWLKSQRNLFIK